jgi:hypothetical protein
MLPVMESSLNIINHGAGAGGTLAIMQMAIQSVKQGKRVLFMSMENTEVQLAERFYGMIGNDDVFGNGGYANIISRDDTEEYDIYDLGNMVKFINDSEFEQGQSYDEIYIDTFDLMLDRLVEPETRNIHVFSLAKKLNDIARVSGITMWGTCHVGHQNPLAPVAIGKDWLDLPDNKLGYIYAMRRVDDVVAFYGTNHDNADFKLVNRVVAQQLIHPIQLIQPFAWTVICDHTNN